MNQTPAWQYDELTHAGVDYADQAVVAEYDAKHQRFRDYQAGANAIVERLGLSTGDTVIDLGCGTGAFCLHAAKSCRAVHAVDVSQAMLDYTRQQAQQRRLDNIEFHHGGFLTYKHTAPPVDAVVSVAALHHLPDFWKGVGLWRTAQMLRPSGRLYLFDVVFRFDVSQHRPSIDRWIESMRKTVDDSMVQEAITHIRDEYSTWDWVLESLLEQAGFRIDSRSEENEMGTACVCTRTR